MRKNVAEVVSNHCCLFFSHVECMEMRDKDHFPSFFAVRSAMWLCSGPWDVTLRFWVQGCYLNFMPWPSWQNRSHVTEQQDGAWDFEAMEEDNSLDICIWHMYNETSMWKKEASISWSPCYHGLHHGSQTSYPTDPKGFLVIGCCHKIRQLRYLGAF